jgi:O-methyltransferase domain/Dimerisation domain
MNVLEPARSERPLDAAERRRRLRQLLAGYQVSRALLAAEELGLVESLEQGGKSVDELARATGTHPPSVRRLLRALVSVEVITERDGRFSLGPLAAGLRDLGTARLGLESYHAWDELAHTLRTGTPAFDRVYGKRFYEYIAEDPVRVKRFDDAMVAISQSWIPAVLAAYDFPGTRRLADLGGGRGTFLATVLAAYPAMRGVLFDQPHVVANAGPVLARAGVTERCELVGGSFLDAVPPGADTYALSNMLADWDDELGSRVLQNVHQALHGKGKLLVIDRVFPSPGDPSHALVAFLDLWFLVIEGGRVRTRDEHERLLTGAGFEIARVVPTASELSVIEGVPR